MTEQGSEAVNPGQAIYDTLSDEAKVAIDALPDQLFDDDVGRKAATLLANELLRVHNSAAKAHSQSVWSVQCDGPGNGRNFVVVNVGNVNTFSRDWSGVRFLVLQESIEDLLQGFGELIEVTDRAYSERAFLAELSLRNLAVESELPVELHEAHVAALDRVLDESWKINQRWKWHRDDWRVKLALLAGVDLPAPAYVLEDRIGLRMDATQQPALSGNETSISSPPNKRSGSEMPILLRNLERQFGTDGLTYSPLEIASFYTALQTKGFVILSGISGTGKSKIAQRFAGMLPDISVRISTPKLSNTFQVKYQQYMKDHGQIRLLNEVSSLLPVPDEGNAYNIPMSIDGQDGTCRFWTRPPKYGGTYIHPHGALKGALMDLDDSEFWLHFVTDKDESRVERIVLRTDASSQTLNLDQSLVLRPNHLFLPVRPDWRDGKALIGYHNPLTGEYVRTDFLDFVLSAQEDFLTGNRNAFFVILDEMNLAHVEYYFADVLSVIESGRDDDGWTVEGIPLAVGDEDSDLPEVLKLPPNLYIVGTVNMDETTHPFSPKVLDRAFTIELTDVDFRAYPPEPIEVGAGPSDDERQALLDDFIGRGKRYPRIDKGEIRATVERHERFRADLASLNASLRRYRMHFGYRVFDEIMQFVHNAERNGLFASANDAFDHAVLMKVLPKFNGSRAKLENPLFELVHWCNRGGVLTAAERADIEAQFVQLSDDLRPFDTIVRAESESVDDDWRYPATGRRAALMMQDLYTDGFASFG